LKDEKEKLAQDSNIRRKQRVPGLEKIRQRGHKLNRCPLSSLAIGKGASKRE
jgi:hypothetical protein